MFKNKSIIGMKNYRVIIIAFIASFALSYAQAQTNNEGKEVADYRRSSLQMLLLESDKFPKKEAVIGSYNNYLNTKFPQKYNRHSVGSETFNVVITEKDFLEAGYLKDTIKSPVAIMGLKKGPLKNEVKWIGADSSKAMMFPSSSDSNMVKIGKFMKESNIAKQLVAKWYNKSSEGICNYDLVMQRGMYGTGILGTNNQELKDLLNQDLDIVANTFVVINKLKFVENEPVAKVLLIAALLKAEEIKVPQLKEKAIELAQAGYEKAKEGYTVWTTSYLYQLDWNADVFAKFKTTFLDDSKIDLKAAWDTTQMFKMKFIGESKASSLVLFSLKETRTLEQIIDMALTRNIDNVFTNLQKDFVVFRPVTPIKSGDPLTAEIGLKDGLEPGQSYEVVELLTNKAGVKVWTSVGSVSVDKKLPIWDNRAGAEFEPVLGEDGMPITTAAFSNFKGGNVKYKPNQAYIRLKK
jgi:hypothetical protein